MTTNLVSPLTVAYLVNQYTIPSHTFIQREILALEERGVHIVRFSVRRGAPGGDEIAQREEARTRCLLETSLFHFLWSLAVIGVASPLKFARAARAAFRLGRRSGRSIVRHFVYLTEAALLRRWLRDAKVSHLHAHFGTNSADVALLCHLLGGPAYSFTVHGPEEFDSPAAFSLREKMARARFTVAISEFGRSQLYRWARLEDWDRLHVVRCGLPKEFLDAPRVPPPDAPRLICVGRLSDQKGHLILLEAARQLKQEGRGFQLLLIGDGPLRQEITRRIQRYGLDGSVQVLGWLTAAQIRDHLRAARALVVPSFAEGLPVVISEALALERPVLATAIAGHPELIEPGVNGWLIPAGSVECLAEGMRTALGAPIEVIAALGRAGARRVGAQYSAELQAEKLERLFRSVQLTGVA